MAGDALPNNHLSDEDAWVKATSIVALAKVDTESICVQHFTIIRASHSAQEDCQQESR